MIVRHLGTPNSSFPVTLICFTGMRDPARSIHIIGVKSTFLIPPKYARMHFVGVLAHAQ